jgi:NADH-quinone oxidoreductase subunit L
MASILILLVIGLPWLGALFVWLFSLARFKVQNLERKQHFTAAGFAVAAGLAALILLFFIGDQTVIRLPFGDYFGDLTFVPDGLGVFLAVVATVVGSLAVIFSMNYMHGDAQLGRYYLLVLIFIGSMAGLALTGSLLFLFIFWEMTALCSYALISFYNDDPKAVAGGIKALIITQVGGIGLLAGALIAYSYLGSYEINIFLSEAGTLPVSVLAFTSFGFLDEEAAKSSQIKFNN